MDEQMPYILDITLMGVKSGVCIGTMINLSSSKGRRAWQLYRDDD
jgi:hypothetical protein